MEVANLLIYMILIIVLVSLIGVSGWLLYDYNNLKTQLSGDFKTISNRFSTHKTKDNTLESGLNTNTSNITSTKTELTESIETVKNDLIDSVNKIDEKTINHDAKLTAFNENLSKYFILGTDETSVSAVSDSLFSWFTSDYDNGNKLKLIKETIIASELTINDGATLNTNSDKKLKVCNSSGANCSDIYIDDKDLIIKSPDTGGKIMIGGGNNNGLVIEDGKLTFNNTELYPEGLQIITALKAAEAAVAAATAAAAAAETAETQATAAAAAATTAAAVVAATAAADAVAKADTALYAVIDAEQAVIVARASTSSAKEKAKVARKKATAAATAADEAKEAADEASKAVASSEAEAEAKATDAKTKAIDAKTKAQETKDAAKAVKTALESETEE
jgi:hypothetical protein